MITIYGAHHAGPGALDTQSPLRFTFQFITLLIDDTGFYTKERPGRRSGF